ncbi:hypothetical protein Lal_00049414 [Lupinus albus]|uniref:Putative bifunctional inhibitor/plant lipid transfer protein/seed storage helical n=1 Tax=Lupinus albus TaxID=3870 RepID=A0A6A5M1E9_LUPAL|nr:putative bifunctional inhibitor/plant lipid transfer protein/seed storage helical [Lupinus albus]KAF1866987.1 hypothetical protein Lal_00049414 [Lupinus albus]
MGSKRATNIALSSTLMLLLVSFASSNINQDKAKCSEQLIGLANCLPYVADKAKSPTIECCTGLKMVIDKSKMCLCVLIKDRDDPSLGLKINVSQALNLPNACHTKTNLTQCVDLLHLVPKSPEAKVFEGFDKAIGKNSSIPVPSVSNDGSGKGNSGGGRGNRWQLVVVVSEILPFVFISHFILV